MTGLLENDLQSWPIAFLLNLSPLAHAYMRSRSSSSALPLLLVLTFLVACSLNFVPHPLLPPRSRAHSSSLRFPTTRTAAPASPPTIPALSRPFLIEVSAATRARRLAGSAPPPAATARSIRPRGNALAASRVASSVGSDVGLGQASPARASSAGSGLVASVGLVRGGPSRTASLVGGRQNNYSHRLDL